MQETLATLIITTTLLLGSPGPVPVALATVGASIGFKKGLPFLCGILTGLAVVILMTFLGLSTLLQQVPALSHALLLLSNLFLFYIAYKIATSKTLISSNHQNILTYKTGFIINLLNPKAYAAMLALLTPFTQTSGNQSVSLYIAVFSIYVVAIIVDTAWLALGHSIQPFFNHKRFQQAIRYLLAFLLITVVVFNLIKTFTY